MDLAEKRLPRMVKKGEIKKGPGQIIRSRTGPDNPPLTDLSQILAKDMANV
jgi:hypothetical protein